MGKFQFVWLQNWNGIGTSHNCVLISWAHCCKYDTTYCQSVIVEIFSPFEADTMYKCTGWSWWRRWQSTGGAAAAVVTHCDPRLCPLWLVRGEEPRSRCCATEEELAATSRPSPAAQSAPGGGDLNTWTQHGPGWVGHGYDEDGAVYHELCSPPPPWFRETLFAETFFICSRARDARQLRGGGHISRIRPITTTYPGCRHHQGGIFGSQAEYSHIQFNLAKYYLFYRYIA